MVNTNELVNMVRFRFRGKRLANDRWVMGGVEKQAEFVWVDGFEVDPQSVCQDTGLYDDRAQPIFEGDIIDFIKDGELCDTPCVVRWHPYLTQFYLCFSHADSPQQSDTKSSLGEMIYQHGYQARVIGNIYDNPEFLPQINPFMVVKG